MLIGLSRCRRLPLCCSRARCARVWRGGDGVVSPPCLATRLLAFRCRGGVLLPRPREALTRRHGHSSAWTGGPWRELPPRSRCVRTACPLPPRFGPVGAVP